MNTGLAGFAILIALGSAAAGCDTFCTVQGRVTRCADGRPVGGAQARLVLVSGGFKAHEEHEARTGADGRFNLGLNEPDGVTARVVLRASGYRPLERTFTRSPEREVGFCLFAE